MRLKNLLPACALIMASASLQAQTTVTAGVMNGTKYGITYILPKTQLKLSIEAQRHDFTPGEFAAYASRYLHLEGARTQSETSYTMENVTLEGIGVPDKDNIYFVEMKDRTVAPLMQLTSDGIVKSINMPDMGSRSQTPQAEPQTGSGITIDPRSLYNEEILAASSKAKMAELIAREIYTIRESRNMLLRGEAENMPKDAGQLQIMIDNLRAQEEALLGLFIGTEKTTVIKESFTLEPEMTQGSVIARFSTRLGILTSDNLAGEPISLTLTDLSLIERPEAEEEATTQKTGILSRVTAKSKSLSGIAYNVPGRAKATVTYRHEKLIEKELPVTQLGSVEYLSNVLFNKTTTTQVEFDTVTGAVLKVDRAER